MSFLSKSLLYSSFIQSIAASFACTPNNAIVVSSGAIAGGDTSDYIDASADLDYFEWMQSLNDMSNSNTNALGEIARNSLSKLKRNDHTSSEEVPSSKEESVFTCPDSSACFVDDTMSLLCADPSTGEFATPSGICGNFITGDIKACNATVEDKFVASGSGDSEKSEVGRLSRQDEGSRLSSVGTSCHATGAAVLTVTITTLLGINL